MNQRTKNVASYRYVDKLPQKSWQQLKRLLTSYERYFHINPWLGRNSDQRNRAGLLLWLISEFLERV